MGTKSSVIPDSDDETWLQLSLDQIYCVKKVIRLKKDDQTLQTFLCSADETSCVCKGEFCKVFQVVVYIEDTQLSNVTTPTGCKYGYGNRVILQRTTVGVIKNVFELYIIGGTGKKSIFTLYVLSDLDTLYNVGKKFGKH